MREFHGTSTTTVDATPDAVFELITNLDRLPEWNRAIERVIERPPALEADAEWVVVMHPPRLPSWKSRSRVQEIDSSRRRFAYRTQTDDGNPSYARWSWEIIPADGSALVTVTWDVHPETIGRQLFAARLRRSGLAREVPASLDRIGRLLAHDASNHDADPAPKGVTQ